jgi:hypothetical protein
MKLSTLIIALTVTLGISSSAFAKEDAKTCIYTACKEKGVNFQCMKINNGYYFKEALVFHKETSGNYRVGKYNNVTCYRDGKLICKLNIPKGSRCDLRS